MRIGYRSLLYVDRFSSAAKDTVATILSLSIRNISQSSPGFICLGSWSFTHGSVHNTTVTIAAFVATGFSNITAVAVGRVIDIFIALP